MSGASQSSLGDWQTGAAAPFGIMIALRMSCPMRLKNLAGLMVGQHLVFDVQGYPVSLTAAEPKKGRLYAAAVPPELTPYVDRWPQVYRPLPLTANTTRVTVHTEDRDEAIEMLPVSDLAQV